MLRAMIVKELRETAGIVAIAPGLLLLLYGQGDASRPVALVLLRLQRLSMRFPLSAAVICRILPGSRPVWRLPWAFGKRWESRFTARGCFCCTGRSSGRA